MKIPERIRYALRAWAHKKMANEKPSVVIGPSDNPYLHRWHVVPRNRFFNVYLHRFFRSDDDRALHDHPWMNCSVLLDGGYIEWVPRIPHGIDGESTRPYSRHQGHFYFRRPTSSHRVELRRAYTQPPSMIVPPFMRVPEPTTEVPVTTLFITGPKVRDWGFLCPQGWIPWQKFTAIAEDGANIVGKGCDQ